VCNGLDALYGLGARWVTFGGGEPLLRPDTGRIADHAAQTGYKVFLSTNGVLLPDRLDELKAVRHVNLSLDGPARVHDAVRGDGAFEKTMKAVEACKDYGKPVSFQCTLSAENLDTVREVVAIAEDTGASVMFQPATQCLDSSTDPNPIAPDPEAYRAAMREVLRMKRAGHHIRNSVPGIEHLMHWPDPKGIWCPAGRLACEIEPDGSILACHQAQVGLFLKGLSGADEQDASARFGRIATPQGCVQCWCAPLVEMALIFSLDPRAVYNAARTMGH
jgi:MoaA/NifB/PqqE/SkfB family radical SAM enzyme